MTNINPKDVLTGYNRVKYFVEDYCKKYPDDRGDQRIHAEDVVRPRNHKWADEAEQSKWTSSFWCGSEMNNDMMIKYERRAPTYGTCAECWASGPSYQPCEECDRGPYMPLDITGHIIDSQTVAEKMKKPHHTARAGLTYIETRTETMKFDGPRIRLQLIHDFEEENPYIRDEWDSPFDKKEKTNAIRELIKNFFEEYDALLSQKRIRRQREGPAWKWYCPEENTTTEETDENTKKKTRK
jgi:hypothetical protein